MASEETLSDFEVLKKLEEELWVEETRFDRSRMEQVFGEEFLNLVVPEGYIHEKKLCRIPKQKLMPYNRLKTFESRW